MYRLYRAALFLLVVAVLSPVTRATSGLERERDLQLTACPGAGSAIPPARGSACSVDPTTACKYDKVCCCANCVDRFRCSCVNGAWECLELALDCLPGTCPPTPGAGAAVPSSPPTPRPTSNPVLPPTLRPTRRPTKRRFYFYYP